MNLARALEDLQRIGRDPAGALTMFAASRHIRTRAILWQLHLPLLAAYPVAALLCPYSYVFGSGPSLKAHILVPLLLVAVFLLQAMLFDRVLEYSGPRPVELEPLPDHSQLALRFHLPLCGAGIFFFLHPALGYVMLLATALYCAGLALRMQCVARGISYARALTAYVSAATLPMLGLVALLAVWNVWRTLSIIRGLD